MTGVREPPGSHLLLDHPAEGVARLTIANPTKRNALDLPLLDTIASMAEELDARCLMVTGAGATFSAGFDIGDIPEEVFADQAERLIAHPFTEAMEALEDYPYPTLAVVNGPAIGGGLELALACDLRIAAAGVRMGMPPAKLGLVYSHTGLRKFIDAIGVSRTRELFLVGRNIDAERAEEWGLVNEVVEADRLQEHALAVARELAGNAPLSQLGNKRVIRELLDAEARLDPEVEQELIELRRSCFASEDFREGVRSFAERRPPRWRGR